MLCQGILLLLLGFVMCTYPEHGHSPFFFSHPESLSSKMVGGHLCLWAGGGLQNLAKAGCNNTPTPSPPTPTHLNVKRQPTTLARRWGVGGLGLYSHSVQSPVPSPLCHSTFSFQFLTQRFTYSLVHPSLRSVLSNA